jgi:hypothetical protein
MALNLVKLRFYKKRWKMISVGYSLRNLLVKVEREIWQSSDMRGFDAGSALNRQALKKRLRCRDHLPGEDAALRPTGRSWR